MYRARPLLPLRTLLFGLCLAAVFSFPVSAATDLIIFVNPTETSSFRFIDSPADYTYEAAALQLAIDAAAQLYLNQQGSSDYAEVRLGYGTYYVTADNDPAVSLRMRDHVRIIGGFSAGQTAAGIEPERAQESVISGNIGDASQATDNSQRLFLNENIGATAQLHSVRLSDSYNTNKKGGGMYNKKAHPTLIGCVFSGNRAQTGGALYNDQSSPALTDCSFRDNEASMGGGAVTASWSSSVLSGCSFTNNAITGSGNGGALDLSLSSLNLEACLFEANSAPNGGAIHSSNSTLILRAGRFIGNRAAASGAVLFSNTDKLIVDRCRFQANQGAKNGGLFFVTGAKQPPLLWSSTFYRNSSDQGSLLAFDASSPSVANCLFAANDAGSGSLLSFLGIAGPTVLNSSFSGNTSASVIGNARQIELINTLISGNSSDLLELAAAGQTTLQGGNILGSVVYQEAEPLLDTVFDPTLHLAAATEDAAMIELADEDNPAIDAGSSQLYDALSSAWQSAYGFDSTTDLIGGPRKQRQIDIGALEYALPFVPPQLTLVESQRLSENEAQLIVQSDRSIAFCYAAVREGEANPLDATSDFVYRAEAEENITLSLPIDRDAWTILVLARSERGTLSDLLSSEIVALPPPIAPTIQLLSYGRLSAGEAEASFEADRTVAYAYAFTEGNAASPLHAASEFAYQAASGQEERVVFQLGLDAGTLHILAIDEDDLLSNALSASIEAYQAPEDPSPEEPPEDPPEDPEDPPEEPPQKPSYQAPVRPNPPQRPSSEGDKESPPRKDDAVPTADSTPRAENYLHQRDPQTWQLQLPDDFSEHADSSAPSLDLHLPDYAELLIAGDALNALSAVNHSLLLHYPALDIVLAADALAFFAEAVDDELSIRLDELSSDRLPDDQPSGACLAAFQLDLNSESGAIHAFAGSVSLRIAVSAAPDGNLQAWCYSDSEGWEQLDSDYDENDGYIVLHPKHFSIFALIRPETTTAVPQPPGESESEDEEPALPVDIWQNPFHDLSQDHPHYEGIATVHRRGWMVGVTEDLFFADSPLQRGMLAVILSRLAAAELADFTGSEFYDLSIGDYYASAALWACQHGLMEAAAPSAFEARDSVDGSQLQKSLARLSEQFGIEIAYTAPPSSPEGAEIRDEASAPISRGEMASILSGSR